MDLHKTHYPSYTTKKILHVTVIIKKCASLAALARYITLICTVVYLGIFNAWYFFSRKHCHHL